MAHRLTSLRWAQDLQQALRLADGSPDAAEVHLELGVVYRRQRDYRRSVGACRTASQLDPRSQQVCIRFLWLYDAGRRVSHSGITDGGHRCAPFERD